MKRVVTAVVAAAVAAALSSGCAARRPLPERPVPSNLFRDLLRLVTLTETAGWRIDRLELENILPDVLQSVCRVEPDERTALRAWLDARIDAEGGDVRALWEERGKELDEVEDLLELTRVRMALDYATERLDDCPFWVEVEPEFRGRQISDDRWQLSVGGGGKGIVLDDGDRQDLSFGGASRLLVGRGFGMHWLVMAGFEGGGAAQFPRDDEGDRGSLLLAFDFVAPVVVRYTRLNSYLEVEAGPLARLLESERDDPLWGWHVGVSVGARASRRGWFFPGAAFGVSYERTFEDGDRPPINLIKAGFRVAIDIEL